MTDEFNAHVAARRKAMFEQFYEEIVLARACEQTAYGACLPHKMRMTHDFAVDLVKVLQLRSGYRCKVQGSDNSIIPRHVICHFEPVPP